MDCHFLLQEVFPTQESTPGLLHCGQILYRLSFEGRPHVVEQSVKPPGMLPLETELSDHLFKVFGDYCPTRFLFPS